jgi:hypothetical protein
MRLRNLFGRQAHTIQGAEKRQQIQSCGLQTPRRSAGISSDVRRGMGSSIPHEAASGQYWRKFRLWKPWSNGPVKPSCRSATAGAKPAGGALPPRSSAFRPGAGVHVRPVYAHSRRPSLPIPYPSLRYFILHAAGVPAVVTDQRIEAGAQLWRFWTQTLQSRDDLFDLAGFEQAAALDSSTPL